MPPPMTARSQRCGALVEDGSGADTRSTAGVEKGLTEVIDRGRVAKNSTARLDRDPDVVLRPGGAVRARSHAGPSSSEETDYGRSRAMVTRQMVQRRITRSVCGATPGVGGRLARPTAFATVLACSALLAVGAAQALATTYYVCNDSSCASAADTNSGTSEAQPWKTIERANAQSLSPGDSVLLHGGDTFSEHGLWPSSSGSPNNPVIYGSYGTGHPVLLREVWIPPHRSWVTIENLTVDGSQQGGATNVGMTGIAASA